jgi:hypothetical protein
MMAPEGGFDGFDGFDCKEYTMQQYNVGDSVRVPEDCVCRARPPGDDRAFHDIRDCYHKPCTVGRVFADGESVWVRNRQGFARRFYNDALVPVESVEPGGGNS